MERQVKRLRRRLDRLQRESDKFVRWRLYIFGVGVVVSAATLLYAGIWWWLLVSVFVAVPFLITVYVHRQVDKNSKEHQVWLGIKESHLARMALNWDGLPPAGLVSGRLNHPFALDLDIVGERSVHRLLDTAVSVEGSRRLGDWLMESDPQLEIIQERQALIQELANLPLFRDKLQLVAKLVMKNAAEKWPGQRLLDWLAKPAALPTLRPALMVLLPLAGFNIVLGLLDIFNLFPPWWLLTWVIFAAYSIWQIRRIGPVFQEAFFLRDSLEQLQTVFTYLEGFQYGRNRNLANLCKPILNAQERPSRRLKHVSRIAAALSLQKNPFVWLSLNAILPWDIFFTDQLNESKRRLSELLPAWLDVWFELEALNSLANFAYLHPDTTFPTIVVAKKNLFQAKSIGHPLIPDETRICNDYAVQNLGTIDIITGSNMAGKSSFLRTLGVNLSLAFAGGPVLADSLRTTLFRLFSSMRIADSVTDGFSYFYAEVQRLQALLSALRQDDERPLFFLIDEIFRGTNNRERLIGSRAYVQALTGGNGVGVIATHDLDLVNLADELPGIANYHFRDDVQDGHMVFDYTLHPGPCPTTNALKIMELAGLPVSTE